MLTDSHNVSTITLFLETLLKKGAPIPKSIVSDCSLALLNAISLSFNNCSYNTYINNCFKFLFRDSTKKLPTCLIKRDRNHLIKNVPQWNCFRQKRLDYKRFLYKSDSFFIRSNRFLFT